MTRAKKTVIKLRWLLLCLWVLCIIAGLIWIWGVYFDITIGLLAAPALVFCGPFCGFIDDINRWQYFAIALTYTGSFFFTQWLFLAPKKLWKIKTKKTARPMKKAAIAAAFAIALLTAGLVYAITDLFSVEIPESPFNILGYLLVSIPLISWLIWSIIFCIYFRKTDYNTWASRIIKALIAGSILELLVSIPIFVTREDDCYCARGSYASIVFSATVLLWSFGPAVFLLFLKQKHHIEKLNPKSENAPPD